MCVFFFVLYNCRYCTLKLQNAKYMPHTQTLNIDIDFVNSDLHGKRHGKPVTPLTVISVHPQVF